MGLDISYYRKMTLAAEVSDGISDQDFDKLYSEHDVIIQASTIEFTEDHFEGRTEGLKPGAFDAEDSGGFRAGSYSGFAWWRKNLDQLSDDVPADPDEDQDRQPFEELLEFFDNEGLIGPVVSKRLAEDFRKYEEVICAKARCLIEDGSGYWVELYQLWKAAFESAADDGCVVFH